MGETLQKTAAAATGDLDPQTWLDAHGDALFRYALKRVGSAEAAEDLVQDALLAALDARRRFDGRSSVRTWLLSILQHKLVDNRRRTTNRAVVSISDDQLERFVEGQFGRMGKWRSPPRRWGIERQDAASIASDRELLDVLRRCVALLPATSAELLMIAARQNMDHRGLGELLKLSATNVGVLLYRARCALRRCLEKNWFQRKARP